MWLHFLDCPDPADGGKKLLWNVDNLYQLMWLNIPEDLYPHQHNCENLKSQKPLPLFHIIYLHLLWAWKYVTVFNAVMQTVSKWHILHSSSLCWLLLLCATRRTCPKLWIGRTGLTGGALQCHCCGCVLVDNVGSSWSQPRTDDSSINLLSTCKKAYVIYHPCHKF